MQWVSISLIALAILAQLQQSIGQSWTVFQNKHVLDPTVDTGYHSWNRAEWNTWLKSRLPLDYGAKSLNSIIAQSPSSITSEFNSNNPSHSAGPEFHWSSTKLPTYVMSLVKSTKTYDAYNCAYLFVLTRLDSHTSYFPAQRYVDGLRIPVVDSKKV